MKYQLESKNSLLILKLLAPLLGQYWKIVWASGELLGPLPFATQLEVKKS